ncbi:radical SAM protein [Pseudoduganella chitinolytica]|uniref:Radical SAM protein n=2 Tax=Pseudoduganella chitinolytica TaxID=34070 RepID=A0ABY8BJT6_9BURK|nr:radical SAM protein [Pseudoduganella chitinolytica]
MHPGPGGAPTLHLHPTRRCNLACGHCYSSSSPYAADRLEPALALGAIRQAAQWGYRRLAISGGEPLLYPWLGELVDTAAGFGMQSGVVTNGLLTGRPGVLDILKRCDSVAVSIDGLHAAHDALRGRPGALSGALAALDSMVDAGIPTSVVCGVSRFNVDEVEHVAAMARAHGASMLQLHVVASSGRARDNLGAQLLDERGLQELYMTARLLACLYHETMQVHVDLVHRDVIAALPGLVYGAPVEHAALRSPAEVLGMLVVEPDGNVNPVCFGFGAEYGLGRIGSGGLARLWSPWVTRGYVRLTALGRQLWEQARRHEGARLLNPSDALNQASHTSRVVLEQIGLAKREEVV